MAILLALGMASAAACKWTAPPCLNAPPPEYYDDGYEDKLDAGSEPELGPCLTPLPDDDASVGPCLEVTLPDEPPMTPCLMVVAPPEKDPPEPRVGPCLRVAAPREDQGTEPVPTKPAKPGEASARADILDRLGDSLPPDVLAKLRKRKE